VRVRADALREGSNGTVWVGVTSVGWVYERSDRIREGIDMAATQAKQDGAARLIDAIDDAEQASLEAVRKFLDIVDGVFPHAGDDSPRRKIIDSAFKMTEQLVAASTRLAQNVLDVTEKALSESDRKSESSTN
jgi:hypothetical protein